jgi:hypothetical protein
VSFIDFDNSLKEVRLKDEYSTSIPLIPGYLAKTIVQVTALGVNSATTFTSNKLITITVYYSTGTILVQGTECRNWVTDEFVRLKLFVETLASAHSADIPRPPSIPLCLMDTNGFVEMVSSRSSDDIPSPSPIPDPVMLYGKSDQVINSNVELEEGSISSLHSGLVSSSSECAPTDTEPISVVDTPLSDTPKWTTPPSLRSLCLAISPKTHITVSVIESSDLALVNSEHEKDQALNCNASIDSTLLTLAQDNNNRHTALNMPVPSFTKYSPKCLKDVCIDSFTLLQKPEVLASIIHISRKRPTHDIMVSSTAESIASAKPSMINTDSVKPDVNNPAVPNLEVFQVIERNLVTFCDKISARMNSLDTGVLTLTNRDNAQSNPSAVSTSSTADNECQRLNQIRTLENACAHRNKTISDLKSKLSDLAAKLV